MRYLFGLLFVCGAAFVAAQTHPATAAKPAAKPSAAATAPPSAKDLPVHQVILYKNGIGYFEHLGQVSGNQRVAIDFTSSQLNDVLQSLTVLDDNGGRIGGVNYNSTTPLSEQLKSLSLAMSDDPSSNELFQALRGQRVEVTGAPGGPITGRLMSVETKTVNLSGDATIDKSFLTVVTAGGGVRMIELTPTLSVRPLDTSLQGQLDRYLELLSSAHSTGLRHLTLDALGTGQRQLRVSYISEVPVWKSTYRIVFPRDSTDKAILQGWAVVDNTIGSDWDNVQLSLVAGAPQSFIQPLSQPLYLRRPEIAISTTAMTTPQTHEAAETTYEQMGRAKKSDRFAGGIGAAAPLDTAEISTTLNTEMTGDLPIGGRGAGELMKAKSGFMLDGASLTDPGSNGAGAAGGVMGGVYRASNAFQEGDISTHNFDDFFQYTLAQPVTIHKNESAMVPILQERLPAERVTLWSALEPVPFRAIWLENSSKLTFDRGSFSIFESGVFAGQGLLDPIHPGEKRLLSYAADQAIQVKIHPEESKRELRKVHIAPRGYIHLTYGAAEKETYTAHNSADEARVVVLEIPRRTNRDLSPETKPTETAANLYRFKLAVKAHDSASILIADEGQEYTDWTIGEDSDQAAALEKLADDAPGIADRLKEIAGAQRSIREMKARIEELDRTSATLSNDEARARENLTALKGNDAGKRFVEELNHTEDELEVVRKETADLKAKEKSAVDVLRLKLAGTEIDWNVAK